MKKDHQNEAGTISILLSVAAPDGTTKFVDQIVRFAPADVRFTYFSWGQALFGRYDAFHVHWPEFLMRGRRLPIRVARTVLTTLLLARLRFTRTPVVRTLHNLEPHEPGGAVEAVLLRAVDAATTLFVVLSEATPVPGGADSVLIPHGHYRDVLPGVGVAAVPRRVVTFGRIEPYKNVDGLIRAIRGLSDPNVSLRVVGRASDALASSLQAAAVGDRRISFGFGFVSDEEMVRELTSAQLVVLPYTEMHNSGVVLVALSLDRPVLVPRTPANERLSREVGERWLLMFDGPLGAHRLREALEATASLPDERPALDGRDWTTVASSYAAAYRRAIAGAPSRAAAPKENAA